MTEAEKNERIKAVEEQMAKLQKELEDIRKEKTSEWDFSEWDKNLAKAQVYVSLPFGCLGVPMHWCRDKMNFILKLIQFKYCYDKDYEPDWTDTTENKWCVYYGHIASIYEVRSFTTVENPESIYFSTQEIARKCADWLNAGCPEE